MDRHTLALISIIGSSLDVLGALYLAYDLLAANTDSADPDARGHLRGTLRNRLRPRQSPASARPLSNGQPIMYPKKRLGVLGIGLILIGFTLQSAQYWAVLLDVNLR